MYTGDMDAAQGRYGRVDDSSRLVNRRGDRKGHTMSAPKPGTHEWVAQERAARAAHVERRHTANRASGRATDETGELLPGVIIEPVDVRTVDVETRPVGGPSTRRAARYAIGAALTARMRDERRAAMQKARDIETARRQRLNAAQTAQTDGPVLTDETAYVSPVADEWQGVPLRTLTALSETGWRAAGDILTALETAYAARRAHTAGMQACMLTEPDRDGRGTYVDPRQRWGVNATETRHTARWHSTPRADLLDSNGRPVDSTCYRLVPPATGIGPMQRVPFVPPVETDETDETARPSTRAVAVDTAGAYAARLAAYGATGDVE